MPRPDHNAFTIVELLVVITIITVLLALLAPALGQAVYQARLAVCGAQQKSVAAGAVRYAADHKRRYPYKPATEQQDSNWQGITLAAPPGPWGEYDDRLTLAPYISINGLLNDPLAQAVDLRNTHPLSHVFANVTMWFGFKYWNEIGMLKIGDRLHYNAYRFDILVCDRDGFRSADTQSTHPDAKALLSNYVRQDADHPWLGGNQGVGPVSGEVVKITMSLWLTFQPGTRRGTVDTNYTYQDLSVQRYNGVTWNTAQIGGDRRMVGIGTFVNKQDIRQHMPPN